MYQINRFFTRDWIWISKLRILGCVTPFFQCSFFQSYWDWLPLELKEYVMALAEAQHKIDLERKRRWNRVLTEMAAYHRYKKAWGWGFVELQTFTNCTNRYCRVMRRSKQPHNHVRLFGKYQVEYTDPQDVFDYHLGMLEQPPQTNASLGLLEFPPRTVLRNIQHTKNIVRRHHRIIV